MSLYSIRTLIRSLFTRTAPRGRQERRRSCLGLELLETREVPALLTVNSLLDLPVDLTDDTVTLRDAIHAAENDLAVSPGGPVGSDADTITFDLPADSVLNLTTVGDTSRGETAFRVTTDITIQGNGQTLAAPGDAATTMRHFLVVMGGELTLNQLTLTGGRAVADTGIALSDWGGAILNFLGTVTLNDCTLEGNGARVGGALATDGKDSLTTVTGSTIHRNSAVRSGGTHGSIRLIDSTVADNTARSGGGMSSSDSSNRIEIIRSTVSGNKAINPDPNQTERSPTASGGGIDAIGTLTIINSTISGNESDGSGGGLYHIEFGEFLTVINSTITGNRSDADGNGLDGGDGGGSILGGGVFVAFGSPTFHNSIVAGNFQGKAGAANPEQADDVQGTPLSTDSSNNLFGVGGSGGLTATNGNRINVDVATVLARALAFNGGPTQTHALLSNSPALNAGDAALAPATDQRGLPRVGRPDLGAFEVQNQAPTDIRLDNNRLRELQPRGSVVGTFRTVDPDADDTFTYTLLSGDAFQIDDGVLTTARADLAPGAYSIRVSSTDSAGNAIEKDFTITVVDGNDAPTIAAPASYTVTQGVGQVLAGLSVGDRDGDRLTVTVRVGRGMLKVARTVGVTVQRHNPGKLTLSGDAAALNAALASLQYRSQGNARADVLSLVVGDGQVRAQASSAIVILPASRGEGAVTRPAAQR